MKTALGPIVAALVACAPWLPALTYAQTNGTVRFAQYDGFSVYESGGANHLSLILGWCDLRSAASISIQVTGGTAREGVDFGLHEQVFSASPDSTYSDLTISGVPDGLNEGQETIELTLTHPTGGVLIGSPSRITVFLADNPNVKSFNLWTYESTPSQRITWRSAGAVILGVQRHGPMMETADVQYQTEPGTAQPGVDYTPVTGTVHFGTNESCKAIQIPILTNSLPAGDRDFRVVLSNPEAGSVLGTPEEQTVRILNDGAGFALEPRFGTNGGYEVMENVGEALVDVVIRGDVTTRPVSVDYRTRPVSATPIEDYTPVSGTLTFAAGETRKTIAIPIINDSRYERGGSVSDPERFNLLLENPTGDLPVSRPREVEFLIPDNDPGYSIAGADGNCQLYLDEQSGTGTVNVNRQGDYNVPGSVHYRVTTNSASGDSGTATAGLDFVPAEGTLNFDATQTNQTFTITLLDDALIEGDENFFILLDQATSGVPIFTPEVQAFIGDDERNPARVDPDYKPDWPGRLLAAQPDGKVVLVTPTSRVTGEDGDMVLRLLPDGQEDSAWKAPTTSGDIGALVPLTNGQMLIAAWGLSSPDFTVDGVSRRHLARLNANGSVDTGFSAELPANMLVSGVAVQRNGQILVAVATNPAPTMSPLRLIRLNASGGLDPAFKTPVLHGIYVPTVLPGPDGHILVTGWAGYDLIRFNSDGSPDGQFQPPSNRLKAMLPDGRLMVTLETNGIQYLVRLTADGQLDSTFTRLPISPSCPPEILPATEGKIWLLNQTPENVHYLGRRNADGSDDSTWPVGLIRGMVSLGQNAELVSLPDGNLLVAGIPYGELNGQPRRSLARLLVNAPRPRFEVDPASAMIPENGGKVSIHIIRCGTNTEPISVTWQTEGGTAKPGVDYVPAGGTLSFPANQSVATLALEVLDNSLVDDDRTVRLRLHGPLPERQEYPIVEITIANDDLGFPAGGIRRFPNGRVLLRPIGYLLGPVSNWGGPINPAYWPGLIKPIRLEASENLRDWTVFDWVLSGRPEAIDMTAPTNAARFYRMRQEWP